jgi:hypothetical protein
MKYKINDRLAVVSSGVRETDRFVHGSFECKVLALNDNLSYYVEITKVNKNISPDEIGKRLIVEEDSNIVCINNVSVELPSPPQLPKKKESCWLRFWFNL